MSLRTFHTALVLLLLLVSAPAAKAGNDATIHRIDSVCAIKFDDIVAQPARLLTVFTGCYEEAKAIGYRPGMARLLERMSLANYYLGKYDKTTEYTLQAIRIFEELKDSSSIGDAYCGLGYQMKRRDLDKAFEYMRIGISMLEKIGDKKMLGKNINNFGVLFEMKKDIDSAIYYYRTSAKLKENFNDSSGIAYSLNNIFQALLIDNQTDSALTYLDQSTLIRKSIHDELGITENYTLYGDYYFQLKSYPLAIVNYRTAMERSKKHAYTYLVQYTAGKIAECYELAGNAASALEYYKIYTAYKDSLTGTETNKAIAELEIRFGTEKKEKEIAQHKAKLAETTLQVKQRNYLLAGLGVVILFIIILGYYIYRQQKFRQERLLRESQLKDQIAQITLANKLQDERLRISRDLHDNIGSQLTFVISSLDNLSASLVNADERTTGRIGRISGFTRDTINQLRDTIWAMNKEQITSSDLEERLISYFAKAGSAQQQTAVELRTGFPPGMVFGSTQGMNIFRVIQEATNNALKHSKAASIDVAVEHVGSKLNVNVSDNGQGFDHGAAMGNGLANMKKRIEEIGGTITIRSTPGKGTSVDFTVPVNTA